MANETDIFGYRRSAKPQGAFSTEDSVLTFGAVDGQGIDNPAGFLVQQWNLQYQQQVQEIFELGSNKLYWSKGRPQGSGSLNRVIGFQPPSVGNGTGLFPQAAYDICLGGAAFKLSVKSGNCDEVAGVNNEFSKTEGVAILMDGCVITSIGYSANVSDTRVMEDVSWRFAFLNVNAA
jgi:hypothetical protein